MIGVQVDRDTCAFAEPGLERQPTLEGPSIWCDLRQARQQTFEGGLATDHVRGRREATGALAQSGFDGNAIGNMVGLRGVFSGSRGGAQAGTVAGAGISSVHTGESSGVWIIGMRYKVINAETTEQVATGYTEEKMEVGASSTAVLGVRESQQGGVSLDTMVQRLIQKSVWEIDNKYK